MFSFFRKLTQRPTPREDGWLQLPTDDRHIEELEQFGHELLLRDPPELREAVQSWASGCTELAAPVACPVPGRGANCLNSQELAAYTEHGDLPDVRMAHAVDCPFCMAELAARPVSEEAVERVASHVELLAMALMLPTEQSEPGSRPHVRRRREGDRSRNPTRARHSIFGKRGARNSMLPAGFAACA